MIENKVLLQSVQYHKTAAGDRLNWDVMRRVHDHSLLLHHPCELTKTYYWTIHVGKVDQKNQEINKITICVGKVDQKMAVKDMFENRIEDLNVSSSGDQP